MAMARVRRRAWALMFATAVALGAAFVVVSPMMANPDEPAHAIKAAAVYQGELRGREDIVRQSNPDVLNGTWSSVTVPQAYATLGDIPACFAFHTEVTGACSPPVGTDVSPVTATTYVGRYQPTYYLAIGWPSVLTSPWRALWLMRLVTVVICAALLASAAASLVEQQAAASPERRRWTGGAWLGLALAITPTVMWLAASINPSAFEVVGALATWVALLGVADARTPVSTRSLVRATVVASVFMGARPLAPVFFLAVAAFVAIAVGSRSRLRELARDRAARWCGGVLALVFLLSSGWVLAVKANDSYLGYPTELERAEIVRQTIGLLPQEGRQMVGVFGWLDTPMPLAPVCLWGLAVAALVVAAMVRAERRERVAMGLVLAALFVLPIAANLGASSLVGVNWVGRYSLPLAVGVPVLAGVVVQRVQLPRRVAAGIAVATAAGVAALQLVALATLLHRYVVGDAAAFWAFLGHTDGWQPPIGLNGALALAVVAVAGAGTTCGVAMWPRRAD